MFGYLAFERTSYLLLLLFKLLVLLAGSIG